MESELRRGVRQAIASPLTRPCQIRPNASWRDRKWVHSSNEPGELSQWLCHDDSTINIVVVIIIIIIHVVSTGPARCFLVVDGAVQLSQDPITDTQCSLPHSRPLSRSQNT